MELSEQFRQLSQCLAGVFQNREQALADPVWFVHFKLWSYPIPLFAEDSATFFLEQASATYAQPPYRQRILRVQATADSLTAEYYALKERLAWQGAAQSPERLKTLTPEHLQPLSGSRLPITVYAEGNTTRFAARQQANELCQFDVNGEVKFVELAFDAIAPAPSSTASAAFWMYDKGIDPATGKATWGAKNGPFKLVKMKDFGAALFR